MGSKLSCNHRGSLAQQVHQPTSPAPTRIIAADGSLKELQATPLSPLVISDVFGVDSASFFVCNSDALYFNEHPPALAPGELLRPGKIYFMLPAAMLRRPLSSADMAALAAAAARAPRRRRREEGARHDGARGAGRRRGRFVQRELNEQTLGEFAVSLNPAKSDEKLAAAAARSRLKRALSVI